MQKRKLDRRNLFYDVVEQIQKIRNEICSSDKSTSYSPGVDETDLSLRKLEELQQELQNLQKEKVSSKVPAGFLSAGNYPLLFMFINVVVYLDAE